MARYWLWRLEIQGGRLMESKPWQRKILCLPFFSKKWMDFPEKGGCVLRDDTVKAKGFTKGSFCGVF